MESLQKSLQNFEANSKELCRSIVVGHLEWLGEAIDEHCSKLGLDAVKIKENGYTLPADPLLLEVQLKKLFQNKEKTLKIFERVS
jgi:hypothetical protein